MKKILLIFIMIALSGQIVLGDVPVPYVDRYCINKTGQRVTCPDSKQIEEKYQYYAFQDSSKKWGLKDNNGEIVIPAKYDYMTDFNEGVSGACINDKCGYIDINEKWVIKPKFPRLICQQKENDGSYSSQKICYKSSIFQEGMAAVFYEPKHGIFSPLKPSINYVEYEAIIPRNYKINPWANTLVNGKIKNNKFYLKGNNIQGLLYFFYESGFINKSGKIVIRGYRKGNRGPTPMEFSEGLAIKSEDNRLYGYINKKGEYVIKPQFNNCSNFKNGIAIVEKVIE